MERVFGVCLKDFLEPLQIMNRMQFSDLRIDARTGNPTLPFGRWLFQRILPRVL